MKACKEKEFGAHARRRNPARCVFKYEHNCGSREETFFRTSVHMEKKQWGYSTSARLDRADASSVLHRWMCEACEISAGPQEQQTSFFNPLSANELVAACIQFPHAGRGHVRHMRALVWSRILQPHWIHWPRVLARSPPSRSFLLQPM